MAHTTKQSGGRTTKAQTERINDLGRRFMLDVAKSGHVFIREMGQPATEGLPVFSTNTREQASQIRTFYCRLARDGSGLYRLNECLGDDLLEIEALAIVTENFRQHYLRQLSRKAEGERRAAGGA
jgi:hypothetical protein